MSQDAAPETSASELQSFDIGLRDGLLEPKHVKNMGCAVWLYIWLIRKMTRIDEAKRLGYVLGGKPIVYEDTLAELGISRFSYMRYIEQLRRHEYILTTRTPRGLIIAVTNAKKSFLVGKKGYSKNATSVPRDVADLQHQKPSDVAKMLHGYSKNATSNIREGNENKEIYKEIFGKLKNIIQPKARYSEAYGKLVKKALKTYSEDELTVSALFFDGQFDRDTWRDKSYKTIEQFLGNDRNHIPRYQLCFEKAQERQNETGQTIHVMTDEEEEAAKRRRAEQTEALRQRHERFVALNAARGVA